MLDKKAKSVTVTEANLADYLGVPKYRYGEIEEQDQVGVATGMVVTSVGGDLTFIKATKVPGRWNSSSPATCAT